MPWTKNASEQAIKGPKRRQVVSGYWLTLATLARYCQHLTPASTPASAA